MSCVFGCWKFCCRSFCSDSTLSITSWIPVLHSVPGLVSTPSNSWACLRQVLTRGRYRPRTLRNQCATNTRPVVMPRKAPVLYKSMITVSIQETADHRHSNPSVSINAFSLPHTYVLKCHCIWPRFWASTLWDRWKKAERRHCHRYSLEWVAWCW